MNIMSVVEMTSVWSKWCFTATVW